MKPTLKMTPTQYKQIKEYLAGNGIFKDGKFFSLLAEARINEKEIDVVILTENQYHKLKAVVKKMGLCE